MAKLILVGRVAGAFGVKGEIRLTAYTDDPMSLLDYRVLRDEAGVPLLTLTSGSAFKGALLARAVEVGSREAAQALRGRSLYIERDTLPPTNEDEFYLADLIGARVASETGETVGRVKFVADFSAGDLLEIEPEAGGSTFYIPFTKDAVPRVDVAAGLIVLKNAVLADQISSEEAGVKAESGKP